MAVSIKGADIFKMVQKDFEKASIMAINKATATTVARMKDNITEKYNIKRKDITSRIGIGKATKYIQESHIYIPHKPLGLIYFGARQTKKGVSAAILKGKRKLYPHTFILNIPSANGDYTQQVFERYGPKVEATRVEWKGKLYHGKRQRIRTVSGMAISQIFLGKRGKEMQQFLQTTFNQSVKKELITASQYLLGKRNP